MHNAIVVDAQKNKAFIVWEKQYLIPTNISTFSKR
jgi:hypothetical protein